MYVLNNSFKVSDSCNYTSAITVRSIERQIETQVGCYERSFEKRYTCALGADSI